MQSLQLHADRRVAQPFLISIAHRMCLLVLHIRTDRPGPEQHPVERQLLRPLPCI